MANMMEFINIGKPILEKLLVFSSMIMSMVSLPDLLRQSVNFSNDDGVLKLRWLLAVLAKGLDWGVFDAEYTDISKIGNWNAIFPQITAAIGGLADAVQNTAPSLAMSNLGPWAH